MTDKTIHVAYAFSAKHGYRAKAYVSIGGVKNHWRTGLGDSANEAMREAITYIERDYDKEGLERPKNTKYHGRKPAIVVDNFAF